jgi:hypothetical protein
MLYNNKCKKNIQQSFKYNFFFYKIGLFKKIYLLLWFYVFLKNVLLI